MPAVPCFVEGGLEALSAEFERIPRLKQDFRIVTVKLEMRWDKLSAHSEVFALIPEELAMELENLRPSAGSPDGLAV